MIQAKTCDLVGSRLRGTHAGSTCDLNQHCASGVCDPAQGYKCTAPAHTQHNWASCTSDTECMTGKCYAGVCRCESHGQCQTEYGGNAYCDLGVWLAGNSEGQCHTPKNPSNQGLYCEDGQWCESGQCTYSGRRGYNICYTDLPQPDGALCDLNQHCASGFCDPTIGYHCATKLGNGGYCLGRGDNACASSHCCFDTCRACCGDADCGPSLACHDYTCQKGQYSWHCQTTQDCQDGLTCVLGACR